MSAYSNPQNPNPNIGEPPAADARRAQTAGATESGIFTSDLSVSEYVLLGEAGFEPLGFVVGSSIYHVGLQYGRWNKNFELVVLTQAMYGARELAMARMQAEADHLGADGIVGVNLRMQMYAWGQDVLEFVATGTAVRALNRSGAHKAPNGRAFTSDLSAQDFFRLLAPSRLGSWLAPACTTSPTSRPCKACARSVRTRRCRSSPRASTRPASSPLAACRRRRRRQGRPASGAGLE